MGFWDIGPFDNDDAGDWIDELVGLPESARRDFIVSSIEAPASGGDVDVIARSIAAAASIACLADGSAFVDDGYLPSDEALSGVTSDPEIREIAVQGLDRILHSESEWSLVLTEADLLDDAHAELCRIRGILVESLSE